jgi:predicted O-methyltransferase YrrM
MIRKVKIGSLYLKHVLMMRSKFRIHSPFVYAFYKNVIIDRRDNPDFDQIEHIRKNLLSRFRFIKKVDLGARAGDMPFSQRFVRVRDIARNSSVTPRKGRLIYRLVSYFKPRTIIELGTSFGISTMYMAMGYRNSHVVTLEGCPDTVNIAGHNFNRIGLSNIEEICGNFDAKLPEILQKSGTVDLVFFDGNHKKEPTLRYFDMCLNHVSNNTILVFDDIHWSQGMKEAWENIRQHPSVTVSIDLFSMGIVFFRRELSKEDFVLRF